VWWPASASHTLFRYSGYHSFCVFFLKSAASPRRHHPDRPPGRPPGQGAHFSSTVTRWYPRHAARSSSDAAVCGATRVNKARRAVAAAAAAGGARARSKCVTRHPCSHPLKAAEIPAVRYTVQHEQGIGWHLMVVDLNLWSRAPGIFWAYRTVKGGPGKMLILGLQLSLVN
jgi:hypothetical protein